MVFSTLGSSVYGILQARILEWVAISFSRGYSWPRDRTQVSRIAGRRFNLLATREASQISLSAIRVVSSVYLSLFIFLLAILIPACASSSSAFLMMYSAAAAAKLLQSCLTLCDPIDGSPPGSSVPGILQARILKWVVISFSNACMHAKSLQLCPTLCNPMDCSPPGSSVHRILQARDYRAE